MNIKIVDATHKHVEGIQNVFYYAWLDTYPNKEVGITIDDVEDKFKGRHSEKRKARLEKQMADPCMKFLVALDGARVVGLCRVEKSESENRLGAIYILPEYQGKGIGSSLWAEVKKFFDPEKNIYVGVATYNQKAIRFYSKLGFLDTGKRYTQERLRMKSGAIVPEMDMVIKAAGASIPL